MTTDDSKHISYYERVPFAEAVRMAAERRKQLVALAVVLLKEGVCLKDAAKDAKRLLRELEEDDA